MQTLGFSAAVMIFVFFYSAIGLTIWYGVGRQCWKALRKRDLLLCQFILFISTLFVAFTIQQNHYIYYWDYAREWSSAIHLSELLFRDPMLAFKQVYHSINASDFNQAMPLLLTLPLKLFGASYTTYIILNFVLCVIPGIIMMTLCVWKLMRKAGLVEVPLFVPLFLFSATPSLYYTVFRGFMDPIICILAGGVILLSIDFDFKHFELKRCVTIAVLLLAITICRRYFPMWVIGYIVVVCVLFLFQLKTTKPGERKHLIRGFFLNMGSIGIFVGSTLLLVFPGYVRMELSPKSYGLAYNGLRSGNLRSMAGFFGSIVLAIATLGSIAVAYAVPKLRPYLAALGLGLGASLAAYGMIGSMDYFHSSIFLPFLWILLAVPVTVLVSQTRGLIRKAGCVGIAVIITLNFSVCFFPFLFRDSLKNIPLFTTMRYAPMVREDLDSIHIMVKELAALSQKKRSVYVLASSDVLNSNLLQLSHMPERDNALPTLCVTHDVDVTEGFPAAFLTADIVVVADPIQTHLYEGSQEVVRYLAEQVMSKESYLGRHFELTREYQLTRGVVAKVYLKTSPLTYGDYEMLQQYYDIRYSQLPALFHDRIAYPTSFFPNEPGGELTLTHDFGGLRTLMEDDGKFFFSTGAGYLVYGPYQRMDPGFYDIRFSYMDESGAAPGSTIGVADVYADGSVVLAEENLYATSDATTIRLELSASYERVELRMRTDVKGITFKDVTITRRSE